MESKLAALAPDRTSKILICPWSVPAAKRCPSGWKAAVVSSVHSVSVPYPNSTHPEGRTTGEIKELTRVHEDLSDGCEVCEIVKNVALVDPDRSQDLTARM